MPVHGGRPQDDASRAARVIVQTDLGTAVEFDGSHGRLVRRRQPARGPRAVHDRGALPAARRRRRGAALPARRGGRDRESRVGRAAQRCPTAPGRWTRFLRHGQASLTLLDRTLEHPAVAVARRRAVVRRPDDDALRGRRAGSRGRRGVQAARPRANVDRRAPEPGVVVQGTHPRDSDHREALPADRLLRVGGASTRRTRSGQEGGLTRRTSLGQGAEGGDGRKQQAEGPSTRPTSLGTGGQEAGSRWAQGIEGQRKADLGDGTYLNPIMAGDHPDPSILKDGDDYYMTFSSFDAYPGLVIWHSRDLVNWEPDRPGALQERRLGLGAGPREARRPLLHLLPGHRAVPIELRDLGRRHPRPVERADRPEDRPDRSRARGRARRHALSVPQRRLRGPARRRRAVGRRGRRGRSTTAGSTRTTGWSRGSRRKGRRS